MKKKVWSGNMLRRGVAAVCTLTMALYGKSDCILPKRSEIVERLLPHAGDQQR